MSKSIVFIHGLGLGEWIFQEYFVPYYRSRGYEVHTFNLPGHTRQSSEAERQRVTLDACVHFVEAYLNARLFQPYIIVGMSMGGAICQKLLEKRYSNENLRGMVLLSSVPPINNLMFTLRLCRKLALFNPEVLIDFFTEKANPLLMFSPETALRFSEERVGYYVSNVLKGFPRLEYALFFQDLVTNSFSIDIPLKIIGGKDDSLFPPEVVAFTASYYSQRADILPGLGHMIPIESNYLKAMQVMDSFLNEVFE